MAIISGAGTFPAGGLSAAQGREKERSSKNKSKFFMLLMVNGGRDERQSAPVTLEVWFMYFVPFPMNG
jgi:hypothetical protein